MTSDELKRLEHIKSLLQYPGDMDHFCETEDCTIENPQCAEMHVKAALRGITDFLDPPMRSLNPTRQAFSDAERIYVEEWKKENNRQMGAPILAHLLTPEPQDGERERVFARFTQRDAEVATTIIQWLGTNCGRCFLELCEKRIKETRAIRRDWDGIVLRNKEPTYRATEVVEALVSPFASLKRGEFFMDQVRRSIAAEIDAAYARGKADALKPVITEVK